MTDIEFVVQVDIPSIKSYVFGTDPLNEIRGASAILDWLNRQSMDEFLREEIQRISPAAGVKKVYANGGSGQFLVSGCEEDAVDLACRRMVRDVREETGGEARTVYGIAKIDSETSYRKALSQAHFRLRCLREFASASVASSTLPLTAECSSASHLSAMHRLKSPDGVRALSEASRLKAEAGRRFRSKGVWSEWMQHLKTDLPWLSDSDCDDLRCKSLVDIGAKSNNKIGLVYADGNAVGRLVRAIDSPGVSRAFSWIVDTSIREACFAGLRHACQNEIENLVERASKSGQTEPIPADILLLGGDDLVAAVPASRALDFALEVAVEFQRRSAAKIASLRDFQSRRFFQDRLGEGGFTISCGVSISSSVHPFYLSLDLAEQLLESAKKGGHSPTGYGNDDVSRIDFHVVTGTGGQDLKNIREREYGVPQTDARTDDRRTLRPLSCSQMESLRASVFDLHNARFPRNKLRDLYEAALSGSKYKAEYRIRDIFARTRFGGRHSEREALWRAVSRLCPDGYELDFPWFVENGRRILCAADIAEAFELFPPDAGGTS